jgi:hypothetical protein
MCARGKFPRNLLALFCVVGLRSHHLGEEYTYGLRPKKLEAVGVTTFGNAEREASQACGPVSVAEPWPPRPGLPRRTARVGAEGGCQGLGHPWVSLDGRRAIYCYSVNPPIFIVERFPGIGLLCWPSCSTSMCLAWSRQSLAPRAAFNLPSVKWIIKLLALNSF